MRDFEIHTDLDDQIPRRHADGKGGARQHVRKGVEGDDHGGPFDAAGRRSGNRLRATVEVRREIRSRAKSWRFRLTTPRKWSAEDPNLYKLLLTVKNSAGAVLEVIPQNVGLPQSRDPGGRFLINGKAISRSKGVNRHEHAR